MYNKKMKKILISIAIGAAWVSSLGAVTQQIGGNFANNITAKAFDRSTGTFYAATDTANGLAMASPTALVFTPIGSPTALENIILANAGITYFNLPSPLMGLVKGTNGKPWLVALQAQTLYTFDGTTAAAKTQLATTVGAANLLDNANNAIVAMNAAGVNRLCTGIATVNGARTGKAFVYGVSVQATPGLATDGVCSVNINLNSGAPTTGQAAQTVGLDKVQQLNAPTGLIAAAAAGGLLGKDTSGNANGTAGDQTENNCWINDLYWDNDLEVLYAGLNVYVRNAAGNGPTVSYALVKSNLNALTGAVAAFTRVTGSHAAYNNGLPVATASGQTADFVFANQTDQAAGVTEASIIHKIRSMTTSTSKKYLILNASSTNEDRIAGTNYAIPNVWAVRIATASDAVTIGGGCEKGDVITPAGALLGNNWTVDNLGATQVGTRPLLFATGQAQFITDMEVVGDTVYASVGIRAGAAGVRSDVNDIGIFSSRALFDNNGIIIGWTPWERVFTSEPTPTDLDAVHFFSVDANRGTIWKVVKEGAQNPKIVKRSTWKTPPAGDGQAANGGLPSRLNTDLADGCTAVLDLPTLTPGIAGAGHAKGSFAVFGGNGKVVFAKTKTGDANAVVVDFSAATAYKVTQLPSGAGYVRALGISRNFDDQTGGYFFAGTDNGLYVWANATAPGVGFNGAPANAAGLTDLNATAFNANDFSWQKMDFASNKITGPVTAIESNGTHLFVVEQDVTTVGGIVSKLHRIEIDIDKAAMLPDTHHVIIAQSGAGTIPANTIFTGFALISDTGLQDNSWGLLSTNKGIYASSLQLEAMLADSNWSVIDTTDDRAFTTIRSSKRVPGTVAPNTVDGYAPSALSSNFIDNANGLKYFQQHDVKNVGINWAGDWNTSLLKDYVNATVANGGKGLTNFDRLNTFWTDGGRRFFTTYDPATDPKGITLKSMPFATTEWGMTGPVDVVGASPDYVFWMENISGLGILMAGTNTGVVTLE